MRVMRYCRPLPHDNVCVRVLAVATVQKMASRSLTQVVQGEAPEENAGLPSQSSRYSAGGRAGSDARRSQIMSVEADMTFGETSGSAGSRLQYTSKIITSQAFEVFDELRRRNQLCDVTIKVDGHEHAAHRVVLAAVSPYFRGMFTGEYMYMYM